MLLSLSRSALQREERLFEYRGDNAATCVMLLL